MHDIPCEPNSEKGQPSRRRSVPPLQTSRSNGRCWDQQWGIFPLEQRPGKKAKFPTAQGRSMTFIVFHSIHRTGYTLHKMLQVRRQTFYEDPAFTGVSSAGSSVISNNTGGQVRIALKVMWWHLCICMDGSGYFVIVAFHCPRTR